MEASFRRRLSKVVGNISDICRRGLFRVLSFGPIPQHIAFIMDGNRRFARYRNMKQGSGHQVGFLALMSILRYCYELGVKYVTIYAFSIDNFKRRPEEVQVVMDLMLEKIEGLLNEGSIVKEYGLKVNFLGNLELLPTRVKRAAEKVMAATEGNSKAILSICVAYTSTDEIVHAVQESYKEKLSKISLTSLDKCDSEQSIITLPDLEKHMYTIGCPDPEILVRTSGETRLSNFLLWQTTFCFLLSPNCLWPEISLKHLVWAILEYQHVQPYLDRKRRAMLGTP
ncbi:hypothetical protein H6P81_018704 [Aristolochia fimbriata]|uniref:Alkyl transferase n=1 Tax=Aristolochia fimbriata TaxID=158543 RepID=A0AAV7E1T8_ARIFI|nr:hypothetical protein H6P81_018704 [Aristolochia fimbriata]